MVYLSAEDFYEKVSHITRMTRQEEIECARRMKDGDLMAREALVSNYLPLVASHMKRLQKEKQTFGLLLYCIQALEKAVDSFNFLQEGETFAHRLSWHLRQADVKYIIRDQEGL